MSELINKKVKDNIKNYLIIAKDIDDKFFTEKQGMLGRIVEIAKMIQLECIEFDKHLGEPNITGTFSDSKDYPSQISIN